MEPLAETGPGTRQPSPFTREDVRAIVERRGWLAAGDARDAAASTEPAASEGARSEWMAEAAQQLLGRAENQAVMVREGARQVLRELAALVLDSAEVNSERYKEIVAALKERTRRRGQELFHPVVLLLDGAARLPWKVAVKSCRQRLIEFCAAVD